MIVLLDNLRSIHNVGSIFRTADAAGVTRLVLCGITPAPHDRFGRVVDALAKVALGAELVVPWESQVSTADTVVKLKTEGFTVLAVEQRSDSVPYNGQVVLAHNMDQVALVMGGEVDGVSSEVLDLCDHVIEIPMHGEKESLNVSVAFGIVVFRLLEGAFA